MVINLHAIHKTWIGTYSELYEHNHEMKASKVMAIVSIQFWEMRETKPLTSTISTIRKFSLLPVPSLLCVLMSTENERRCYGYNTNLSGSLQDGFFSLLPISTSDIPIDWGKLSSATSETSGTYGDKDRNMSSSPSNTAYWEANDGGRQHVKIHTPGKIVKTLPHSKSLTVLLKHLPKHVLVCIHK